MKAIKKIAAALILAACISLPIAASAEDGGETPGEKSIFESAYGVILDNADEIFSALAFIGALILGTSYRRGLVPKVSASISGIGDAVGKIREASEEAGKNAADAAEAIVERLCALENSFDIFTSEIELLRERLKSGIEARAESEGYRTVLLSQVDMLYSIFMSSSMPQYQKEEISARIGKMKEELAGDEKKEE